MVTVLIKGNSKSIERQIPPCSPNWNCRFTFDESDTYDYLVVLEDLQEPIDVSVDKSHCLLFQGEPPYVKIYNRRFTSQFGYVFGCNQRKIMNGGLIKHYPLLPWMIGLTINVDRSLNTSQQMFSYQDFSRGFEAEARIDKFCIITSNKTFTEGHRRRVSFVEWIMNAFPDLVDVYGSSYKYVSDKFEVLSKYKYSIVIENCQYNDYWTEKLGDCYLAGCYPLYYGCPNISDYFPKGSYCQIDINDFEGTIKQLNAVKDSHLYDSSTDNLDAAKKLVLDKYNIFPRLTEIIHQIKKEEKEQNPSLNTFTIKPMKMTLFDKVRKIIAWKYNIVL